MSSKAKKRSRSSSKKHKKTPASDPSPPDAPNPSSEAPVPATEKKEEVAKTFGELGVNPVLCESLGEMGWSKPTPIQRDSLPYSLEGRDVIGLAQTGSGKTGAFCLPILQSLMKRPQAIFALILAPVRELAYQIAETVEALGAGIGINCVVLVGGMDPNAQALALAKRPHVIVATPGRVVHHLQSTKGFSLKSLKYLVLDEADRLLNLDFEEEINTILSHVPRERNTFLFSATMTSQVAKLQRASLVDPVKVEVNAKNEVVGTLTQNYIFAPEKYKDCYLVYLLNQYRGNLMIVFTIQVVTCQRVTLMLRNLGFQAVPLHGKMTQTKRLGSLNKFKSKERNILVATDVAARGLDIPSVDLVVNYDIPLHKKDYVHRVGRTARAGKGGRAISIVTQYDVEIFMKTEEYIGEKLDVYKTEESDVLTLLERVNEAQRYAAVTIRESGDFAGKSKRKREHDDGGSYAHKWKNTKR
eukprot:TRINITY_DN10639_c0_g1_i1.p1 TRINITY_DN10639_c0_g1~~TRINITY_DN10639_c0_g1_i1.p1  ORF type:complete len:471 (+),score=105.40 TRINITY_DN10639_c0_g1_i1:2-1414(+)